MPFFGKPNGVSRDWSDVGLGDSDADQLPAQKGVLHQAAAAIEVFFHAGAGARAVVPRDRLGDLDVRFRGILSELAKAHAERHESIDLGEAPFDQFERKAVPRTPCNCEMEADIRHFGLPVIRRCADRHPRELQQPFDLFERRQFRGSGRRRAFEEPTHVERIVDLLNGDASNEVPVTDDAFEIALLPESRKAFADGCAAHAMLAGETHFRQGSARAIATPDDRRLEIPIRALDVRRILRSARGA